MEVSVCQVAISTTDVRRSHHWYRRALGLRSAGELRHRDAPVFAQVPDLPECTLDVWCLVDGQPFFQFEMIEFQRPRMRSMPDDWHPRDIGYSTVGLHVS